MCQWCGLHVLCYELVYDILSWIWRPHLRRKSETEIEDIYQRMLLPGNLRNSLPFTAAPSPSLRLELPDEVDNERDFLTPSRVSTSAAEPKRQFYSGTDCPLRHRVSTSSASERVGTTVIISRRLIGAFSAPTGGGAIGALTEMTGVGLGAPPSAVVSPSNWR